MTGWSCGCRTRQPSAEWLQVFSSLRRFTDQYRPVVAERLEPMATDRAYSSWYSNGIVAIDVSDPTQPQRVGQFVPDTSRRHANSLGVGPAEVWGVAIDPETRIVYASDMRTGLWIVQPTGPAAPS
jgi:hypothetical protein